MDSSKPLLQVSPEHYSALFDQALDAVVGMDTGGHVVAWNPVAEELFGWSFGEAVGRRMEDLIVPHEHRKFHEDGLRRFNETGEGPVLNQRIKIIALRRNGETFPVELAITPVRTNDHVVFFAFLRSLEEAERAARNRDRRQLQAETMARISDAQMKVETTDAFIQLCLKEICTVTGSPVGHFYMVDSVVRPSRLLPTSLSHVANERYRAFPQINAAFTFEKNHGLPGMAWAQNDVLILDALEQEPKFQRVEAFRDLGLGKGFAFPIVTARGIRGVMEFFAPREANLRTDLKLFCQAITGHVAAALQRKEADAEKEVLQKEIAHRIGNSFAILNAIFRRCAQNASSLETLCAAFEPRLIAVSRAHRSFVSTDAARPSLRDLVQGELDLLPECGNVILRGPDILLPDEAILPLTVIVHELVSNTLKYGVWHEQGTLDISWSPMKDADPAGLHFVWKEMPASHSENGKPEGYGSTLIKTMVERSLGGSFTSGIDGDCFVFDAEFPVWSDPGALT